MTVNSTTNKNTYVGTGAVDTYAYSFRIFVNTDLLVTVADTDGVETELTLTTDYTVTGVGAVSGGNVVLVNSGQAWLDGDGDLETGYTLVIKRVVELKQETDIRNQGDYFPENHEDQFDKHTMADQQQQEEIDRTIKVQVSDAGSVTNFEVPAAADSYIGWNSDGTEIVNKTPTSLSDSGPTINTGDAKKVVRVNDSENAYQLSTVQSLIEAITTGTITFNTAVQMASSLGVTGLLTATGGLTMGSIFKLKKGADVASAGALTLGDDGNIFDITGTTNITSITAKTEGTVVILQFDGILTVTDGSNLKIRGDFVTAAEYTMMLYCDGTNWIEISRSIESVDLEQGGMIKTWSGSIATIPSGYVICDGSNSTPDLTDRFVIHADSDSGGTNDVGDTGGASTHALTEAELATHSHTVTVETGAGDGAFVRGNADTANQGTPSTSSTGSGSAHTNRDKHYALAFVMKT